MNEKWKEWVQKIKEIGVSKLLVMLGAGIILMFLSAESGKKESGTNIKQEAKTVTAMDIGASDQIFGENGTMENETQEYVQSLEERLKKILEQVDGLGKVEVMITLKSSKESIPLLEKPYRQETVSETDSVGGNRVTTQAEGEENTVYNTADGGQMPYVVKEMEPQIEGVLVIAQGLENATVESEIIEAVDALFDVAIHKIKVMKKESK